MSGPIRLACLYCDREDFDGIDVLPDDWEEIEGPIDSVTSEGSADWWTHIGWCPACLAQINTFVRMAKRQLEQGE